MSALTTDLWPTAGVPQCRCLMMRALYTEAAMDLAVRVIVDTPYCGSGRMQQMLRSGGFIYGSYRR